MLKVNKPKEEPLFFKEFKKKNKLSSWNDYDKYPEIKADLKTHMLNEEQDGYCPYCERSIDDNDQCHIEHIQPKGTNEFASKFQDYDNFLTSCNGKRTCGYFKKGKYSDNFINPVESDPKKFLRFDLYSGKVMPLKEEDHSDYQKASYTIKTLNLNDKGLLNERVAFLTMLSNMEKSYEENEFRETLEGFIRDGLNFKSIMELYLDG